MACVSGTLVRTAAVIGLPLARLRAAIPEEILGGPPAHHVTGRRVLSAVYLKDVGNRKEVRAGRLVASRAMLQLARPRKLCDAAVLMLLC